MISRITPLRWMMPIPRSSVAKLTPPTPKMEAVVVEVDVVLAMAKDAIVAVATLRHVMSLIPMWA